MALIPTTIGALLSAIGIAGMDRLVRRNVLALSGRAVEASGDVDVLLLDKTGTITLGNRQASEFVPMPGVAEADLAEAAQLSSLADETPEGRSIVVLAKQYGLREHAMAAAGHAAPRFVPFTAQTRMSGVDINGTMLRKGAADAIAAWVRSEGGTTPAELDGAVDRIAREGGTPLAVARNTQVLGVIYLKDTVKEGMASRFERLRAMGIRTVMVTGDNKLTAAKIAEEAGVDDFLAEATPERKMELIRHEQAEGRLVAMTGDGTNDAPALAQADVGVAMNTGTQAAREAGNMVDLDSNPTKLIEIVEVGKQLLITRGALTTFSIANDVAKYFAILPAIFAFTYAATGSTRPARRPQRHGPGHADLGDHLGDHLQRADHPAARAARPARRAVPPGRRHRAAAAQPARSTASAASSPRSSASSSSTWSSTTCWGRDDGIRQPRDVDASRVRGSGSARACGRRARPGWRRSTRAGASPGSSRTPSLARSGATRRSAPPSRCATRPPPATRGASFSTSPSACRAPRPVDPDGVRLARELLVDGCGPLYAPAEPGDLPGRGAASATGPGRPWCRQISSAVSRAENARQPGAATTRSSSAWPPGSARPTACCWRATPSRRPGATSSSGCSRPTGARRRRRWPRGCRSCRSGASPTAAPTSCDMDLPAVLRRKPGARAWSTSWRTPTRRGSSTRSATRTSRTCSTPGIDVLSTVNVQHLESLNDQVAELSGVRVRETVPDSVLGRADEVVLIDLSPEALLARLRAGKVYKPERIDAALNGFFRIENLAALREVALRQVAEEVEAKRLVTEVVGTREDSLAADLAAGGRRAPARARRALPGLASARPPSVALGPAPRRPARPAVGRAAGRASPTPSSSASCRRCASSHRCSAPTCSSSPATTSPTPSPASPASAAAPTS